MGLSTKQLVITHSQVNLVVPLTGVACPLSEIQIDRHKPLPCGFLECDFETLRDTRVTSCMPINDNIANLMVVSLSYIRATSVFRSLTLTIGNMI